MTGAGRHIHGHRNDPEGREQHGARAQGRARGTCKGGGEQQRGKSPGGQRRATTAAKGGQGRGQRRATEGGARERPPAEDGGGEKGPQAATGADRETASAKKGAKPGRTQRGARQNQTGVLVFILCGRFMCSLYHISLFYHISVYIL